VACAAANRWIEMHQEHRHDRGEFLELELADLLHADMASRALIPSRGG
jgi:hypothetical protein